MPLKLVLALTVVPLVLRPLLVQISHPLPRFYPVRSLAQYRQQIFFGAPKCVEFIICFFKSTNFTLIFKFWCNCSKNFIWYEKVSTYILIYETEIDKTYIFHKFLLFLICKNWQIVLRRDRLPRVKITCVWVCFIVHQLTVLLCLNVS